MKIYLIGNRIDNREYQMRGCCFFKSRYVTGQKKHCDASLMDKLLSLTPWLKPNRGDDAQDSAIEVARQFRTLEEARSYEATLSNEVSCKTKSNLAHPSKPQKKYAADVKPMPKSARIIYELEVPDNSTFPIRTIPTSKHYIIGDHLLSGPHTLVLFSPVKVTAAYIGNSTYKMKGEGIDPSDYAKVKVSLENFIDAYNKEYNKKCFLRKNVFSHMHRLIKDKKLTCMDQVYEHVAKHPDSRSTAVLAALMPRSYFDANFIETTYTPSM